MVRRAALLLSTCLVACCSNRGSAAGGKATMFTRVWTFDRDAPYHDGVLRYATLGETTAVVAGHVIATATGALRWERQGIPVGVDGATVIERVDTGDRITGVRVADAATGATVREVALSDGAGQPVALRAFNAGLQVHAGALVYVALGRAQVFDLATGRRRWEASVRGTSSWAVGSGELLGVVGDDGLVAFDVATGAERWRAPTTGDALDLAASPRGGFFVQRGDRVLELAADGREARAVAGRFGAADGEFLVVTHGRDVVVVDGGGAEVERIEPSGGDDYLAAPGLCGRAVVYFRNRDATVWWHPASGPEVAVTKIEAKSGVVDGERHTAGATLTEPPRCVGGLVLIQDWNITAYRIPS